MTTRVDKMDDRPGGGWRFVARNPDGSEEAFPWQLPRGHPA